MKKILLSILILTGCLKNANSQNLYFPPLSGTTWDMLSADSLGWCSEYFDSLDNLLDATHSKAFIILKNGKIVHEKYFGTFTMDSLWYWASAGKSLTSFLVGLAAQENLLKLNDTSSKYLDTGWTFCPRAKEDLITVRHQLTMTTGLNDNGDLDCTDPNCLTYLADAGTRWSYHNAPYTLLDGVIESASGQKLNIFMQARLKQKTGMDGLYFSVGANNVFFSKPRSMARFGLLMLNRGTWDNTPILTDSAYYNAMINSSQNINPAYGYLWWLNGKSTFMIPQSQIKFNGSLIPEAPDDMYAALGKNDQKLHVVPSENLVLVRMGDAAYDNNFVPIKLDRDIWRLMNKLRCGNAGIAQKEKPSLQIYPNPANDVLNINYEGEKFTIEIFNSIGEKIFNAENEKTVDVSGLPNGIYYLRISDPEKGTTTRSFSR